jgi:hypothetical protein
MTAKKIDRMGRRSRTLPQSTGKRIRLTERDLLWLSKINTHGPLSTSELYTFGKHLGGNEQRAKNRLTDLFNEDNNTHGKPYLTRPNQQFNTVDARYKELVYDLTPAGIKALQDNGTYHLHSGTSLGPWWHGRAVAQTTAKTEIDTLDDPKTNYIAGWQILERAELTTLRYPTKFTDPYTGRQIIKDLIPDAIYGLEFVKSDGLYYRFHCVEVDRGTEPKASSNMERKSLERMKLQYEDYIGNERYKTHLGVTAPLSLLLR